MYIAVPQLSQSNAGKGPVEGQQGAQGERGRLWPAPSGSGSRGLATWGRWGRAGTGSGPWAGVSSGGCGCQWAGGRWWMGRGCAGGAQGGGVRARGGFAERGGKRTVAAEDGGRWE